MFFRWIRVALVLEHFECVDDALTRESGFDDLIDVSELSCQIRVSELLFVFGVQTRTIHNWVWPLAPSV